ncbi:MAG: CerR family C-terminal domain-containing protein [Thermodesulfobacteriota bacterium]
MLNDAATPARLLEAGRRIFARDGLVGARTRDICALAQANVAAVNYHFGSKEHLYIQVLTEHVRRIRDRFPLDEGLTPGAPPEDRLRAFVRGLLQQLLADDNDEHAQLGKLILLEMVQPSQHVDVLIAELLRPVNEMLRTIVRDLMHGAPDAAVTRGAAGVVSQFTLFRYDPRVLDTLGPDFLPSEENLLAVAEDMVEFSLGGIERLRSKYASCGKHRGLPAHPQAEAPHA